MRKPNSNAVLLNLPEDQQAQLCEWLMSGLGYHRVVELVQKEFGITTSMQAMSRFWDKIVGPAYLARRARAVKLADVVADDAAKNPGQFDQATLELIKQKAFDVAANPNAPTDAIKDLLGLCLKARDQDIAERKAAVDEQKLQLELKKYQDAVEKVKAEIAGARKGGLQPETLQKVEEALNLL